MQHSEIQNNQMFRWLRTTTYYIMILWLIFFCTGCFSAWVIKESNLEPHTQQLSWDTSLLNAVQKGDTLELTIRDGNGIVHTHNHQLSSVFKLGKKRLTIHEIRGGTFVLPSYNVLVDATRYITRNVVIAKPVKARESLKNMAITADASYLLVEDPNGFQAYESVLLTQWHRTYYPRTNTEEIMARHKFIALPFQKIDGPYTALAFPAVSYYTSPKYLIRGFDGPAVSHQISLEEIVKNQPERQAYCLLGPVAVLLDIVTLPLQLLWYFNEADGKCVGPLG